MRVLAVNVRLDVHLLVIAVTQLVPVLHLRTHHEVIAKYTPCRLFCLRFNFNLDQQQLCYFICSLK